MQGNRRWLVGALILAITLMSCNLSTNIAVQPTPTAANTPTPENTATEPLPPTFRPPLELPTSTPKPPTETLTPTETITNTPTTPTETSTSTLLPYDPNASPTPPPTIPSGYSPAATSAYSTPTITSLPPTARAGSETIAIQFTPTIDGDWGEWPNAEMASGYVVFGGANWVNANDLNSSFKTAYDVNYLYIAARVIDDIYAQNATGHDIYLGDGLEILLDTNLAGDYNIKTLSSDDYQLGISPGKGAIAGAKEAYIWYPKNAQGTRTQVVIAPQASEGGYWWRWQFHGQCLGLLQAAESILVLLFLYPIMTILECSNKNSWYPM